MCFATLGIIGAVASAGGTMMGAMAQGQAASYQSQVAANNATIANQNAAYAAHAGAEQAQQKSMQGAAQEGAIKGAMAANGVDVNSGSAVDVDASARESSQLNTETTANNAQLQVYGYRAQATNFQAQSTLDSQEAAAAPIDGALGAAGSLLGNVSSIGIKSPNAFSGLSNLFTGN